MSTKIRVRNFQAIGDAKIEAEGLTVITGRSNLGKTALIRAAAAMLFGTPGDHYIRRGQDWVGGAIAIDDGKAPLKIVWRKVAQGKRKPSLQPVLEINGQTHTKIGRDHKQLTAPFGIIEIETTATRLRPQVAMQHDPIFLVAETETTAAELFKMLGRVDVITEAQRLAKKDLKDNEDRRKIRGVDRGDAQSRLNQLDHVPTLRTKVDALKSLARETEGENRKREATISQLREFLTLKPRTLPTPPEAPKRPENLQFVAMLRELKELKPRSIPVAPEHPKAPKTLSILPTLKELKLVEQELRDLERRKTDVETTVQGLEEEKLRLEQELKICPTCRRPFDAHDHQTH